MSDYTTNCGILKREIFNFSEALTESLSRPRKKFAADMCYGILASGSSKLTAIAHTLQEKTKKINTVERLARNLNRPISDVEYSNYHNQILPLLPERPVIHIDNSDVIKPSGKKFESICKVRDGSKSTSSHTVFGNGYIVTEVTAMTKSAHPVSLFSEIWTTESSEFTSGGEFSYTKKAIEKSNQIIKNAVYVMDRGYDSNDVFELLNKHHLDYVIRLKLNRTVRINGKTMSVQDVCNSHKGKYTTRVFYHGKRGKAKITAIPCSLRGMNRAITIILVYGLSPDHPMVLATNLDVSSKDSLIKGMHYYFSRWRIEEYFRSKKQMFHFEDFRVRSLKEIQSLNFYLSACMLFLARIKEKSKSNSCYQMCVNAAKPIREIVYFFYYRIAAGIQTLLLKARTGIHGYYKPLRPNQRQMRIPGFARAI